MRLAKGIEVRGQSAVIINADSAQVYADLEILSARPTTAEMAGIEHKLYGTWNGAVPCSAADWARAAKQEIAIAQAAGSVPILVGGTGLYIRTLLDGIAPVPDIDPAIREAVRALPQHLARDALEVEDPEAAARLAPTDASRTTRALEVVRSTGRTLLQWQAHMTGGIGNSIAVKPLVLLPERDWLYSRCDARFRTMLEQGACAEAVALLKRQLDPELPVMRAIGVREIIRWVMGEMSEDEMVHAAQTSTRRYAKRQYTWFANQSPQAWRRVESHYCYDLAVSDQLMQFGD